VTSSQGLLTKQIPSESNPSLGLGFRFSTSKVTVRCSWSASGDKRIKSNVSQNEILIRMKAIY